MVIELLAPFHWNRAVLNAGELVDLPLAVARHLVEAGQAHEPHHEAMAKAVDEPPENKLMTPKRKKFFTGHTRQEMS